MGLSNKAMLRELSADRALASRVIFPHRHPQASPPFHIEVIDLWRSAEEFVQTCVFRDGAKTTLSEEFLLLEACFQNFHYGLIICDTYAHACERLEAIKNEATSNMKILNLFGRVKGERWSENVADFANGTRLQAAGWDQELRNFKYLDRRPQRALCDGIETKERVRDASTVDANWRKFWTELVPAMDKTDRKIRWTDTPLADDCLVRRFANDPSWTSRFFPICNGEPHDPETVSLWPQRYPMAWIRSEHDKYMKSGMLREFNQERRLIASGSVGKPFEEAKIKYVDMAPAAWMPKHIIIDPNRTSNATSDMIGEVVVSRMGTKIYVHASDGYYAKPDALVARAYDRCRDVGAAQVAIEKDSLDDWLLQPLRAEGLRRGTVLPLKALNAPKDRDKKTFILGLQPFLNAGDIVLVGGKSAHPTLVAQMLNFPSGKVDVLNALAYVMIIFSGTPVYDDFGEANVAADTTLPQAVALALAFNASPSEVTAALVAIEGQSITVLHDWVSSLSAADTIPDILTLVRALYPQRSLGFWAPAELWDQAERLPLVGAMRRKGMTPQRGEYGSMSRGALSPLIRTELHRRRLLRVGPEAIHTLNALSGGYSYPVGKDGRPAKDPEHGPYRTLIEGLESMVAVIGRVANAGELPEGAHLRSTPGGHQYMTSLPRR